MDALAPGGEGIVHAADGRIAFASGVARGELVRVEIGTDRGAKRVAKVIAILEPSADRVGPSCPHVGRCGGCDWMHLSLPSQAREHAAIVRGLLTHAVGSLEGVDLSVTTVDHGLRSRARFAFRCTAGESPGSSFRSRKPSRPRSLFGYRARGGHELVTPDTCEILEPGLLDAAREVTSWLTGSSAEGELSVGFGRREGVRLPVVSVSLERGELPASFARAAHEASQLAGIEVRTKGASRPMLFGDPRVVQVGMDGLPLFGPAGGFFQASDTGAIALAKHVCEVVGASSRIHELFSGSGTFSVGLARLGALSSVEQDPAAVACARQNLADRGLEAALRTGDAETLRLPGGVDTVVLDPPRTGAPGAVAAIVVARPKRVVYVACDPATLARDAATLHAGGYHLTSVRTFELFPHTSHVETVAVWVRQPSARLAGPAS